MADDMSYTGYTKQKDNYKAYYLTPIGDSGDDKVCAVEDVQAGKKFSQTYVYPASMFSEHFHGTLIVFYKNDKEIKDIREIVENFDLHLEYITAFNLESLKFNASDGVVYDFSNNFFCNHNKQTAENLLADIKTCNSFYLQLIIENLSGKILDMTLISNPTKDTKYAYEHRIVKGFVSSNISELRVKSMTSSTNTRGGDEKLSQEDIDDLFKKYIR